MPKKLAWYEPAKESRRHFLAELGSTGVFRFSFWLRVTSISAIIGGALIAWAISILPNVSVPWLRMFAVVPMFMILFAIAFVLPHLLILRQIDVREKWIQVTHGQHVVRISRDQIDSVELNRESHPAHLSILYRTRRGTQRVTTFYVRESIDLDVLALMIESWYPCQDSHAIQ